MKTEKQMMQKFADKGYRVGFVLNSGRVVISSIKGYTNARSFNTLEEAYSRYFSDDEYDLAQDSESND